MYPKQLKHFLRIMACAAPLLALAATAQAQYYGGISFSAAKVAPTVSETVGQFVDLGFSTPNIGLNDKSGDKKPSYGVKLGYQFNPNIALEANFVEASKLGYNPSAPLISGFGNILKADGYGLDVVGTLPITRGFSLFGRAGVQRLKNVGAFASVGGVDFLANGTTQNSTAGKFGVGLQYDVSRNLGLRLEMERFRKIGGNALGSAFDGDNFSLGVMLKF
jgi:OmpA-OmpF porin, OOP family